MEMFLHRRVRFNQHVVGRTKTNGVQGGCGAGQDISDPGVTLGPGKVAYSPRG